MKTKKLLVILFLIFLILFSFNCVLANEDTFDNFSVNTDAVFLMDNKTNKVLYSKNEDKKMYPASTTKILTAIIVIESTNLDDIVTASYDAIMSIPDGYATANIQIGEQLTVEQLLELMLVYSANDAATVLAEYVGGSVDSFVSIMNTKLNELGLSQSHFTNPYGKHDENHYTTAHDLAFIMKYCLKNDTFRKISGQASCAIPETNKSRTRTYTSTNELLIPGTKNYYPYIMTGKTGYTTQAKECLVSSSYRNDLELIGVVLGSDNRFSYTRSLYEYAYSNYSMKYIVKEKNVVTNIEISNATKETKNLDLLVNEDILALVNNSDKISEIEPEIRLNENILAPIEEGDILGKVTYTVNGVNYTTDLIASHTVEKSKILSYALYISIVFIVLLLIYKIYMKLKRQEK